MHLLLYFIFNLTHRLSVLWQDGGGFLAGRGMILSVAETCAEKDGERWRRLLITGSCVLACLLAFDQYYYATCLLLIIRMHRASDIDIFRWQTTRHIAGGKYHVLLIVAMFFSWWIIISLTSHYSGVAGVGFITMSKISKPTSSTLHISCNISHISLHQNIKVQWLLSIKNACDRAAIFTNLFEITYKSRESGDFGFGES